MSVLATYSAFRKLQRSQWFHAGRLRERQERRLRRLVRHAYGTVPYYRRRFDEAGVDPAGILSLEDLNRVPVTTKADLQAAGSAASCSTAFSPTSIVEEHTSGSSGRPFTVRFDPHFVCVRDALFLRALWTAGYRLGRKLLLVTAGHGRRSRPGMRWRYASIEDPPERVLASLNAYRPSVLYGCVTPLRRLAELAQQRASGVHRPDVVLSTAEALDTPTRRLLEATFLAEVYDAYGLTEMGMVGWECSNHDGYHLSEDTTIVEFLDHGDRPESRLVMTNLELAAMPLIRFDTGDLGVRGPSATCRCGRALSRLARVEGRIVDCLQLRDGRTVSPYRITSALEKIPGLRRYQVVQRELHTINVRVEAADAERGRVDEAVRLSLRPILGADVVVEVKHESTLETSPGNKFRTVESMLARRVR